jgi:hypothetical protein
MMRKPLPPNSKTTQIKPAPAGVELILKVGTALLISFAATLVLVHAVVYFGSVTNHILTANSPD